MSRKRKSPKIPLPTDPIELGRVIVKRCLDAGFAMASVCEARPTDFEQPLRNWLDRGKHGEMWYMKDQCEERLDPRRVFAPTKSIIVVADRYAPRGDPAAEEMTHHGPMGTIARYARGRDYHLVIRKRLHAMADQLRLEIRGAAFRTVVDTAPVMEREHAVRAGIGWMGKHTLVLHPRMGSWVLLGCVLTSLDLRPEPEARAFADHCGTCTRCIDACPTGAITPRSVDARKCVSYLTIEHRTLIAPEYFEGIGQRVFGCDVCQEVCPYNAMGARDEVGAGDPAPGESGQTPHPLYASNRSGFSLASMLSWTMEDRQAGLGVSSMKRATLEMLKRNALIAAGNAIRASRDVDGRLIERVNAIAASGDEPALVRDTAKQVLAWLGHTPG